MKKIKYLVMDVDGTLTDGKVYIGNNGEICKAFCIKDGYGIRDLLIPSGIIPIIITGRESAIVFNRCRELGITRIYQGISDKYSKLIDIVGDLSSVAYIGDDINDLSCMKAIIKANGLVGCPSDAVNQIQKISDYVSKYNGGEGAVRDFIEWLISEIDYNE